jgi:putative hydrolase of the HAD superfamily
VTVQPRAILFDLDDTLINDTGDVDKLWREVSFEAAARCGEVEGETLLRAIDRVRLWYWDDAERHREGRQDLRAATRWIVNEAMTSLGLAQERLAEWVAHEYRDRRDAALHLIPGAIETLERVRLGGVRTALLTNGSAAAQRAKIERFDLARHFDAIFIEGEFGRGKPDPSVYQAALQALAAPPGETWMVGDNLEWDVAAPQRLGVSGIWIDRRGRGVPADAGVTPHRVIRHVAEL